MHNYLFRFPHGVGLGEAGPADGQAACLEVVGIESLGRNQLLAAELAVVHTPVAHAVGRQQRLRLAVGVELLPLLQLDAAAVHHPADVALIVGQIPVEHRIRHGHKATGYLRPLEIDPRSLVRPNIVSDDAYVSCGMCHAGEIGFCHKVKGLS